MWHADAVLARTGRLPWYDDWATLFGDRTGLVTALRHRLTQQLQTQLDPGLDETALEERWRCTAGTREALGRLDAVEKEPDDHGLGERTPIG